MFRIGKRRFVCATRRRRPCNRLTPLEDGTRTLLKDRERSSRTHWNHKLRPTGITTRGSTLPLAQPRYARLSIWWTYLS